MRLLKHVILCTFIFLCTSPLVLSQGLVLTPVPDDFPRFTISPETSSKVSNSLETIRQMYWLHYPGAGPKSTFWDAWLPSGALWPDTADTLKFRQEWKNTLLSRKIDADGYVSSHQHAGLAHADGWPFPLWTQSNGGVGWQFTLYDMPYAGADYGVFEYDKLDDFTLNGITSEQKDSKLGWKLKVDTDVAMLTSPATQIPASIFPFVRLYWMVNKIPGDAHAYLEWTTESETEYPTDHASKTTRRMAIPLPREGVQDYSMIHVEKHPDWKKLSETGEKVTGLRLVFEGLKESEIVIANWITAYDSRHTVNQTRFIRGCCDYLNWTGDVEFLRANIERMRRAMEFSVTEFQTKQYLCAVIPWTGHDGRSGHTYTIDEQGNKEKTFRHGVGVGGNYWDILPFGGKDCLTTIYHYDALRAMTELEKQIDAHPEWNISTENRRSPQWLSDHAREIKNANGLFWNSEKGRFVGAIDVEGIAHDFGFTFLNCEAIYYGYANEQQAKSIMDWISGQRTIDGETSTGDDIYHWRFAPRTTTQRNLDWYFWGWTAPESLKFGWQIQDGGAVLGFSYHDLMSRLCVTGADDAAKRLEEIAQWFTEVQAAGGYREYYNDPEKGSLQGGNIPGGLGMDREFFESVLTPQVMLYGFLGFTPRMDGFAVEPKIPTAWKTLTVDQILWQDQHLAIMAAPDKIEMTFQGPQRQIRIRLPAGDWKVFTSVKGSTPESERIVTSGPHGFLFTTEPGCTARFIKTMEVPMAARIDMETVQRWSQKFRGWSYYPEHVIAANPKIPGYEQFQSTDCPTVFQIPGDSKWYMTFIAFDGHGYNSFVAESTDLIHWDHFRLAMGFGPDGGFDHGGCVLGAFWYDSWKIDAPRTLKKQNDKYWSLYGCYPLQGGYELRPGYEGLAESDDAISWRRAKSSWTLSIHEPDRGEWEKDCVYQPWLVEHDGVFYDFYNAANGGVEQTGVAFSDDLFDWKRFPQNPIIPVVSGAYNEQFSSDPKVFFDDTEANDPHWTMLFFGVGKGGAHVMAAYSRDLLHWVVDPEPLYRAGGNPNGLDAQYAHKISLVYDKARDTWFLYYCAVGNQGRGIGLLTSRPVVTNEKSE